MNKEKAPSFATHSLAAERNKAAILTELQHWLHGDETVLEIGSATGQHALFFCEHFPNIHWQCSDQDIYLPNLIHNLKLNHLSLPQPIALDVSHYNWKQQQFDVIYTANTLHIMTDVQATDFLKNVQYALKPKAKLIIYGPFRYGQQYTSASNKTFDQYIQQQYPGSGIKDFDLLMQTLTDSGLTFVADTAMPANNQFLVWEYSK